MLVTENHSLRALNTFGLEVYAKKFTRLTSVNDIHSLLEHPSYTSENHLVLGGGSNILFTDNYDGLVVHMATRGKSVINETEDKIYLKVQAGENWDDLVTYCVNNGWGGLENLSLIPGQVGSSPIQNIGAYGTELKEHFHSLEAIHKKKKKTVTFSKEDCKFGYRDSYFKNQARGLYIIISVTFVLDKKPVIKQGYDALAQELNISGIGKPSISDIRDAVCRIRRHKLPDPEVLGNAGSFFKNPVVSNKTFKILKRQHPDIVAYPAGRNFKLAAAWLIDHAGWKGHREGKVGVHDRQALVLVNYGGAKGKELLHLSSSIKKSVLEKYGVNLQPEVNII